ncbi:MAG TPA: hypothetical protein VKV39_05085 [Candidatus Sulfotelmatobacter sp.]|nr:hypothetical protein [Candidatus Sulfotelmatobacter sp.]
MTLIRTFLFAGLLALSLGTALPAPASSEGSAHGEFSLTHEVHWKNALIPAGTYRFWLQQNGATGMLTLSRISDARTGFMILVNDIDDYRLSGANQLVLDKVANSSYVRELELPKFGIVLHFPVPAASRKTAVVNTSLPLAGQ